MKILLLFAVALGLSSCKSLDNDRYQALAAEAAAQLLADWQAAQAERGSK